MRIVCSGGGTGGHIFPAVAVAQELKKRYPNAEVLFIGAKGKMEMRKVPKAGFQIKGLWISGWQRSLTFKNVLFPLKLVLSIIDAYLILKKFQPDIVTGFGGYASGAAVWVASKMGIPTLIMEQNSYPGITNKILNGKVDTVCIAYKEATKYFDKSRTVLTGNPIREGLNPNQNRTDCQRKLGLNSGKRTILIIGGSLGARSINKSIEDNVDFIAQMHDVQILWQCGGGYFEQYKKSRVAGLEHVHLFDFIDDMAVAYGAADLVICRAGALTIAEVMYMGKAVILVPSPNVAEDHQTKNAMALAEKRSGILLPDNEVSQVFAEAIKLLNDDAKIEELRQNIKALSLPDAVNRIVDEIEVLIVNKKNV